MYTRLRSSRSKKEVEFFSFDSEDMRGGKIMGKDTLNYLSRSSKREDTVIVFVIVNKIANNRVERRIKFETIFR